MPVGQAETLTELEGVEVLELLLERSVGGLRGGEIAGLESLTELREELADGILGRILRRSGVMMMVQVVGGRRVHQLLLEILLDGGVVLLGGGKIAGLKVLGKLAHGRGERAGGRL